MNILVFISLRPLGITRVIVFVGFFVSKTHATSLSLLAFLLLFQYFYFFFIFIISLFLFVIYLYLLCHHNIGSYQFI